MTEVGNDRLAPLRERVEQQRQTIDALKRDGHECPDAERHLRRLIAELQATGRYDRRH